LELVDEEFDCPTVAGHWRTLEPWTLPEVPLNDTVTIIAITVTVAAELIAPPKQRCMDGSASQAENAKIQSKHRPKCDIYKAPEIIN